MKVFDADKLKRDVAKVREGFWPKLRAVARRIPFAEDATAAYYCAIDAETPVYVKAVLMGALAYFIVPTDMIPDVIAGLGFTDDATVLLTALTTVRGHVTAEHREKAKAALAAGAEDSGPQ